MKTSDFYYDLPPRLIAQTPAEPRDSSRMLAYNMKTGAAAHKVFREITDFIQPGDLLVINNTRVINARLDGVKRSSGGKMEFLLLKRIDLNHWEVMVKPGKKAGLGTEFVFGGNAELTAKIIAKTDSGGRVAEFLYDGAFEDVISRVGHVPLPHYIKQGSDIKRYNTVYAEYDGSAAAPTAGLHFTPALMEKIRDKGAEFCEVLLHVGLGTFRPVKADNLEGHKMHSEYCVISDTAAAKINTAKRQGRRIIAVGTTSVRTLESMANNDGTVTPGARDTDIFIYPPYKFKAVDALITNFHLPESTLLMLLSAFIQDKGQADGIRAVMDVYAAAIKEEYRFFSFGDAGFFY